MIELHAPAGGGSYNPVTGPTYAYTVNELAQATSMSQINVGTLVSGVSYNAAGQITQMSYEGRTATGSSQWPQTYGYDGFGNLNGSTQYDIANRLRTWDGGELYGYRHDNRRLWKYQPGWGEEFTFWGVDGKRWSSYKIEYAAGVPKFVEQTRNVWFGAKLIRTGAVSAQASVVTDRLGSVRVSKVGSNTERLDYYPYGDEKPSATTQDREKFATYYRDSTGLDYADQRYYRWEWGRFGTPDPYKAPRGVIEPQGWNRYTYVIGEPINLLDPNGLDYTIPDNQSFNPAHPGNVTPGHTSVTVSAGLIASAGLGGGMGTNSLSGEAMLLDGPELAPEQAQDPDAFIRTAQRLNEECHNQVEVDRRKEFEWRVMFDIADHYSKTTVAVWAGASKGGPAGAMVAILTRIIENLKDLAFSNMGLGPAKKPPGWEVLEDPKWAQSHKECDEKYPL